MNNDLENESALNPTYDNVFQGVYKATRLENRRVVCAACRVGNVIAAGARHFDTVMHKQFEAMNMPGSERGMAEQGFIDQFGLFLTREEAFVLATEKGQIKGEPNVPGVLFSEDLY